MTLHPMLAGPEPLVSVAALAAADDQAISVTIEALVEEQKRRALAGGDIEALLDEAFTVGFESTGKARMPYLRGGLLICPGSKQEKSKSSHDCTFVSADDTWVWEHPDVVADEMRLVPGTKATRQSVTILPAPETFTYDVVTSTARSGGPCQMSKVRTFTIIGAATVETAARARSNATSHR